MRNINQVRKSNGRFGGISHFLRNLSIIVFVFVGGFYGYGGYSNFTAGTYKEAKKVSSSVASAVVATAKASEKPNYEANAKKIKSEIETKKNEVVNALCTHGIDGKGGGEWGKSEIKKGAFIPTFDPSDSQLKAGKCSTKFSIAHDDCFSFGKCQIKVSTAQYFQKEMGNTVMGEMETLIMLHDEQKSKEFAKEAIFAIPGSIRNWTYAVNNWEWFNTRITEIREQEKFIQKLETI